MIAVLLSIISVMGYSKYFSKKLRISIFTTPIVVVSLIAIMIYVADYFRGAYFLSCVVLLIGLCFEILLLQQVNWRNANKYDVRPFLPVLTATLFIFFANGTTQFSYWDEFSHWGLAAKFLAEDRNLISNNPYLYFRDYPPGLIYIGYYFTFLNSYSESGLAIASGLLALFSIAPIFSKENINAYKANIVLLLLYFLIIVFFGQGVDTVLADQQMSALAMAVVIILWKNADNKYLWYVITPIGGLLALSKQPGIYIYIMLAAPFLLLKLRTNVTDRKKNLIGFIYSIAFISFIWGSWKLFAVINKIPPSVASANPVELVLKLINCCKKEYQYKILTDFAHKLFTPEPLVVFVLFVSAISVAFVAKKSERDSNCLIKYTFCLLIGFSVYLLQLLLHYMFAFGVAEGSSLASFNRFMMPFLFVSYGTLAVAICPLLNDRSNSQFFNVIMLLFAFIVVIIVAPSLSKTGTNSLINRPLIINKLAPLKKYTYKYSSVMVVWQNDGVNDTNGLEYWVARQELAPRRVTESCYSFSPDPTMQRVGDCIWAPETFLLNAMSFNYIVFIHGLDEFQKKYPEIKIENKDADFFEVMKGAYNGSLDSILRDVYLIGVKN